MPRFAGTLTSGNLSTGGGSNYLYVVTQWGFARASLADPLNPGAFSQVIIGDEPGSGNGGLIQLTCDCHQGATAFAAAEAPDGSSRMVSDFNAARQAPSLLAPAQVGRTDGAGGVRFGQQAKLGTGGSSGSFTLGSKIGAVYVPASGKFFGYVPSEGGVAVLDLTNTNGNTAKSAAMQPVGIFGNWSPSGAARVSAFRVTAGADYYLLVGSIDGTLRVANINPASGLPTETASIATAGNSLSLQVAAVNGRIFVFSAEGSAGLRAYEYTPSSFGGALAAAPVHIAGDFDRVIVKGGSQYPAIFAHNKTSSTQSAIEIYDSNWATQGGNPRRAFALGQAGSGEPYFDNSFEVIVRSGTAYVYRLKSPGVPNAEVLVAAHAVDISCITADVSAPPVANLTMTNLSAAQRSGAEASKNYFGDRWRVQDSSSTAAPLTNIEWDWNVLSSGASPTFAPDAAISGALPNASLTEFNPAYFPCDPSGVLAGDPRTGANCYGSVGSVPGGSTFRLGVLTRNANGPSTTPFISEGKTILAPVADISALDRSTTPFVLRILRGGSANASPSQGNLEDATFFWTFTTPSGPLTGGDITTTSPSVTIPSAATGFRMNVTYRGGYRSPDLSGNISQVDLVPSFTLSPDPVVKNGGLNLTNTMQIASVATLNSVDWAITSSSAAPAAYDGQLLASFLSPGGTDSSRVAPGTPGNYFLHLRYNYSVSGSTQTPFLLSRAFTVIDQILLSLSASPSTADAGQTITFTATGGLPTSTYGWNFGENVFGGLVAGGATNTHAYSSPGSFTAVVCVTNVSPNVCATAPVTVTGTAPPPPPPPPPPGGLSATLTCPSSAGVGASVSCTATATGGSSYTYGWNWGDNAFAFSPGPATNSHTYTSAGTYIVAVQVTSGSSSTSATATITIGGSGPPPGGNITASLSCPAQGATGTAITCTASASGGSSYSYSWNWGDNAFSTTAGPATHSHTYSSPGAFTVTVQVTSGTASAVATANVTIVNSGPPAPAATYTVTGATQNQFNGNWDAEAGRSVAFHATEPDPAATFSWAVSNGGPTLTGRDVTHSFSGTGSRTVTLTVTGGGTVTSGVTATQIRFNIAAPRFQALMIPGAGHIDPVAPATDGTWATDLSITNPGSSPMMLTLYFEPFGTEFPADLSQIPLDSRNNVALAAGQSYSATDVVSKLSPPKTGRGVLLVKYEGGNAEPIATATVYYTQQGRSYGSSLPTFRVGPFGTTTLSADVAGEQTLVGLRNDPNYRFNVSLFNASGQSGSFRLTAFGEDGIQVPLLDAAGAPTLSREFPIGPFQQALLQAAELGLNDPARRYVLKASPSSAAGALIAAASALDRRNNDLVQVSDDTPRLTAAADALIEYYIPGVGRIGRDDVADGPHWKTDLTLYSSSSLPRDLIFEYRFTDRNGAERRVLAPVSIGTGRSLILDDVVGAVLAQYAPADVNLRQESTQGLLKISYRAAGDSTANPLLIGGRIYDDRGTAGTAGMQLFVYSNGESVAPGSPLVLPGAQQNLRFRTNIGFFAMGDLPTNVRVSGVKLDGTVAGTFEFILNDGTRSGHYVQLPMSAIPGIVGEPMTIKVEVTDGSRVGAYVVTVDQISSDTVFVQGRPTRLAN
jgi:PKD repeat protein